MRSVQHHNKLRTVLGFCFGIGLSALLVTPARAASLQVVNGHVPAAVKALSSSNRLASTNRLNLAIGLPLRQTETLTNMLRDIYDPASPNFHHFITPEQFTAMFGPTDQDIQAVTEFARTNGFQVTEIHSNHMLVDVEASVADIERAFHVRMLQYQHPTENRAFYAPSSDPSLALSVPVLDISGLNNYSLPKPRYHMESSPLAGTAAPNAGTGPNGGYMGSDFRAAYAPDTTLNGAGQVVGLLQFDGYTASDITYYESKAGLPNVPLMNVLIDGAKGMPSGTGGEVEVSLDIEMAISMAPGLSKVVVYEAPQGGSWHDLLNRMANDNVAKQLSCSWYIPNGGPDSVADQIFQQMALQGQSFFAASGDFDAYAGSIPFPGDTPYITEVGGTTLTTSGSSGVRVSETVWNWGLTGKEPGIGSGGGISTSYAIPSYQTNINMSANQGSTTHRNIPDVALTADNVYVRADGSDHTLAGTSCAAPLWAGFAALINQQAAASGSPPIGFLNPALDTLCSGPLYANCFHDITTGNNTNSSSPKKFYAVTGYDLCTGWGTPAGQHLISALANPEPLVITPATGFDSIGGAGGPFTVTSQSLSLTNTASSNLNWSLANTSAWLKVSPTSGTLSAFVTTQNVVVSLNSVASNLAVGTYTATIWFTNLSDKAVQSRQYSLAILAPPTITRQPADQAVLDGQSTTFTVQAAGGQPLSYHWRFNGANLMDGGTISGSTSNILTIANVSTPNVGAYSVIVSNVAAVVASSNAQLSILPSAPVITEQPTNFTVLVGLSAQFSVTAVGNKPFAYQWSLNQTNIPGATNALLLLTNVLFNQAGNYSVTVSNAIGATQSSDATLTVLAAPPCSTPDASLVSWWKGEGNAFDMNGGNNGSLIGGATYNPGEVGQGFVFSANGQGVLVGSNMNMALQNLTIEGWIQRSSSSIVSTGSGGNGHLLSWGWGGFALLMNSSGTLWFTKLGDYTSPQGPTITDTNWHHVALTFSGSAMIFYLDGVAHPALPYSTTFVFNTEVGIGYRPDNSDNTFLGTIDEMSLYSNALSAATIQSIYNAGISGKCYTPQPPVITAQPTNMTVGIGGTASFGVAASGTGPMSYQWAFNQTNIPGATNAVLLLTNVQFSQAGDYSATVSNSLGSVQSSNAVLTVLPGPPCTAPAPGIIGWWQAEGNANDYAGSDNGTITGSVSYTNGEAGQAFLFTADRSMVQLGSPTNLYLQNFTIEAWIKRNSASVSSLNYPDADLFAFGQGGYGFVLNSDGTLDLTQVGVGNVKVNPGLTDTNWHHVAVTKNGSTVVFYRDGVAYPASSYNPTFTFTTPVALGGRGDTLGNSFYGAIDELSVYNRALAANEIQVIYNAGNAGKCYTPTPPQITSQPASQSVPLLGSATFSVTATGTPSLTYQWFFNRTNLLVGATNSTLLLTGIQYNQAGDYHVVVSNAYGYQHSRFALLNVTYPDCTPAPSGLVSWWKGDGTAKDAQGTNNGTLIGGATYGPGKVSQGFVFNGSSQGVLVGSGNSMDLQNFTIEGWIQRGSSSIVSHGSGGNGHLFSWGLGGYVLFMGPSGTLNFAQLGNYSYVSGPSVTDTNFHHIAVTKSNSTIVFYLDGVAYTAPAYNVTFTFTTEVGIGYRPDNGDNSFLGTIDEISLYDNALSTAQIQAIYNIGSDGKCPPTPIIATEPVSQLAMPGCSVGFTSAAIGASPLSYQWWKDGAALSGQTNSALLLNNIQSADFGQYWVVVTNAYGSAISYSAELGRDTVPTVASKTLQRFASGGVKVPVSELLTNATDADGDILTIVSVSTNSANNGNVLLQGDWIYYTPPAGFTNTDTYTYVVSDGHCGGTNVGVVTVAVMADGAPTGTFGIQRQANGSAVLSFEGFPGRTYRIQCTSDLGAPVWHDLSTNTADNFGTFQYSDPSAINAATRYYRAVSP